MRRTLVPLVVLLALVLSPLGAVAQTGHPLKGTWSGDWGTTSTNRSHVLLELNWDGKIVSGVINPGPNAVPMSKADLDPSTWTVHFEADGPDGSGKSVHYVIDGKVENLGSPRRFITGTWTQGGVKGDFKVVRN
jgi:hypothetical protein